MKLVRLVITYNGKESEKEYIYSLVAHMVKTLPPVQEMLVQCLGREDPVEKGMATHSSIQRIPWTEEPGGLQSIGS